MITIEQQEIIKDRISKYNPTVVGVFGSYARGEQTPQSDLDLLVSFERKLNLLELIDLEQQLSDLLGVKVDLVTDRSVSEHLRPYIEQELISLI